MDRHAFPRCLRLRDEIGEEDLASLVRAKARQRLSQPGAGGLALLREDDHGTGPRGAHARDDVAQQRLAGDGMEDLRRPGLHPCPEARREHEGQRRFAHEMRSGWGARIRTWDSGSKVRRLTTWPRPTDPGASPPRPPTGTAPC